MKLKQVFSTVAVAASLFCASAANAELYNFTVSGDYSATWQMDSNAMPDLVFDGTGFAYADVTGTYQNAVSSLADLYFLNASFGGGISIEDYYGGEYLLITDGPQIYSGTEDAPTFLLGTYALTEYQGTGSYTLTVSAVPEPATYGMLLAGMGLVGVALRRKQAK